MTQKIEIDLPEALRVFRFMEEANHLFHQPLYYRDKEMVEAFARKMYPEIRDLYYKVVWDWLPADVQESIVGDEPDSE